MPGFPRFAALALLGLVAACATVPPSSPPAPPPTTTAATEARAPVTILISLDGFRPDYLDRGLTPNLSALAAGGLSAAMRPAFPSKTFPNHWTLVTGLVPDRHGIVSNTMEDVGKPGEKFTMATDDPFWWNAAPPIWVDAEQAGIRTATMFWPGSDVAYGGVAGTDTYRTVTGGSRPEDWLKFNIAVPSRQRVDGVIDWLRRPAANRPRFVTVYFDTVDTAGHRYGPASPEMDRTVAALDGEIGRLVADLRALGQPANLVVVADHGMAGIAPKRTVPLSDLAAATDARVFETGPFATFYPVAGHEAALEVRLLAHHDHVRCWRKADIPARLRYGANPRIPPYFCLADTGWMIAAEPSDNRGNHGYDNAAPDMAALFIASGPAFPRPAKLALFDNVDVYPLLRDLLGLPPKPGIDGDDTPFRGLVKQP